MQTQKAPFHGLTKAVLTYTPYLQLPNPSAALSSSSKAQISGGGAPTFPRLSTQLGTKQYLIRIS